MADEEDITVKPKTMGEADPLARGHEASTFICLGKKEVETEVSNTAKQTAVLLILQFPKTQYICIGPKRLEVLNTSVYLKT
jgi:hypothetical protein